MGSRVESMTRGSGARATSYSHDGCTLEMVATSLLQQEMGQNETVCKWLRMQREQKRWLHGRRTAAMKTEWQMGHWWESGRAVRELRSESASSHVVDGMPPRDAARSVAVSAMRDF